MSDSPYANPSPYASIEMERVALTGRLKVARGVATRARDSGDLRSAARWEKNVDALLEHLSALDDRATSAAMDEKSREAPGAQRPSCS